MRYYEIIRVSNQDFERSAFETVKRFVRRGWIRKAMEYLQEWDYGGENLDTARCYGRIWDAPTDPDAPRDTVIRTETARCCSGDATQYLVESSSGDGLYLAYYLTGTVTDEEPDCDGD